MNFLRVVVAFLGLAGLLAITHPVNADEWDKATKVTFNEPVQVPGMTLPAGTYTFRLDNTQALMASHRHVVRIYNADHTKLITTVLAVPNERLELGEKTVLMYQERPSGEPMALEAWFYPGDNLGQQFAYPRSKAQILSKLNNTEVPSTDSEKAFPGASAQQQEPAQNLNAQNVTPAQPVPENRPAPQATAPAPAVQSTPTPSNSAASSNSQPAANPANTAPAPTQQPAKLPQTASEIPLIGLAGLAFLSMASLLHAILRRARLSGVRDSR